MATSAKAALAPHPALSPQLISEYDFRGRRISLQPFTEEWIPQVKAFNTRMVAGGLDERLAFPEDPSIEYPRLPGAPVWQEAYLAVDNGSMCGAYYFTHERYAVEGGEHWIANYRHPISEVLINKAYKGLGSLLLSDGQQRQPLLYSVGFGSAKSPNLQRLSAEGWKWVYIPFWAKVIRPSVFLRQIEFLRKTPLRRLVLDAAAFSGAGWVGLHTLQTLRAQWKNVLAGYSIEEARDFGFWADELWDVVSPQQLFAAVRDRAALNTRYPSTDARIRRIKVSRDGSVVGWAVLIATQMKGNPYFGDMHVGTIVDCLAAPGHESAVVRAAADRLKAAGVDLIVSNQSADAWCAALKSEGFFSGPSNYILAFSAELADRLEPLSANTARFHVNRGDGAGTVHL